MGRSKKQNKEPRQSIEVYKYIAIAWSNFCEQKSYVSRNLVGKILVWFMASPRGTQAEINDIPLKGLEDAAHAFEEMARHLREQAKLKAAVAELKGRIDPPSNRDEKVHRESAKG